MTLTRTLGAAPSANDIFKQQYPRCLRLAALAAVILTLLMVWFSPRYEPQPYQLRQREMFWVDIPEPPEVVEQPQVQAPPQVPKPIEEVSGEDELLELDPEPWIGFWDPPASPTAPPADDTPFVVSSSNPRLLDQARADYPEIARRAGLEGTVVVHALVGPDGLVDRVVVVQGVHPLLDRAAMAAARRCRFEPARQREVKVRAWVAVPYRFRLH